MGAIKSKALIKLQQEDLQKLTRLTHFNAKEVKAMYKRYWAYCSKDGLLNKDQFNSMLFYLLLM